MTHVFFFSVPMPAVEVAVIQHQPYLSGMFAELRCIIHINDAVDAPINVAVTWQRDGIEINTTSRVSHQPLRMLKTSVYEAKLQFNTLSSSYDNGLFKCISTILPAGNKNYAIDTSQASSFQLSVIGMIKLC